MNRTSTSAVASSSELFVTFGTCLVVAAGSAFALILNKISGASSESFWSQRFYIPSALVLIAALAALCLFTLGFRKSAADRRIKFWFPLALSLVGVTLCFIGTELSLRAIAQPDPLGVRIGRMALVPYDWKAMARKNLMLLDQNRSTTYFYIEDPLLGWTIGPNREGNGGMYKSSAEGLRSMTRGAHLDSQEAQRRVALFGDSFTFGEDVSFEESWGHFLELGLGGGTQVLNFGVSGYGVDQAYLRFKREAPKWTPAVSVLAFIQDDLYRSVFVYPFFRFNWERPFSKPRFVMTGGKLEILNVPAIQGHAIFDKASTWDLPLLEYEANFDPYSWQPHIFYSSYLVRFMATRFPRWRAQNGFTNDDAALQLGSRLIEEFVELARSMKSDVLLLYIPSRNDFYGGGPVLASRLRKNLAAKQIEVRDMTSCLTSHVPPARLYVEGKPHYSREGNAALAMCTQPLVQAYLTEERP
jgi:hypothetical protein